jgi:hypothetical protein
MCREPSESAIEAEKPNLVGSLALPKGDRHEPRQFDRQIHNPIPIPCDLVVKNRSKISSIFFGSIPHPESSIEITKPFGYTTWAATRSMRARSSTDPIASIAFIGPLLSTGSALRSAGAPPTVRGQGTGGGSTGADGMGGRALERSHALRRDGDSYHGVKADISQRM